MSSIALDYLANEYTAKGRTEGVDAAREENALSMFADHLPVDKVAKYSNLSLQAATAIGKKHGYLD